MQDFTFLKTPAVMASVWLCHPETRGTVSLRSARSEDPPVIRHELLGAESDVANLRAGCRLIRDIFAAEPLSSYVVDELAPGSAAQSDEDLTQYLRAATVRGEHASGTCRMGVEGEAVVDPELKVYGVEGLRVVDASVIPSLITGHTNAPTIMIAEKAASLIRS